MEREVNRFKVFLRSGTVITMTADKWWGNDVGWLYFYRDDEIVGHFAPGMWEGIQDLRVIEPKKVDK